jgi:hypothetical protein
LNRKGDKSEPQLMFVLDTPITGRLIRVFAAAQVD